MMGDDLVMLPWNSLVTVYIYGKRYIVYHIYNIYIYLRSHIYIEH